jgi:hypothetical protein
MMAPLHPEARGFLDRILADRSGDFCWATEHI